MSIIISGGGGGGGGGATTLNGLSDVNITSVANGQIIAYNNTSGNWENQTGITGGLTYKGAFNATTGTPSLLNAVQGDFYVVSVAGTIYGQTWNVGDHLLINEDMGGSITNSKIDKVDNTDQVTSVNGQTGAVTGLLEAGNNLSDLTNVPTARSNLSLGAAATANDTDGVPEGAANLYYTNARADGRIAAADLTDLADVSYTAGPGIDNYVLTYDNATSSWGAEAAGAAPVDSVNGATGVVVLDTDDIAEGAANLYFTDARADARADARIAAADLTDLNDVSYTAGPGIDNYVLTFDNATSSWGAEAAPSAPVDSVNGATGVVVLDSDDVAEGAANLYFTNARADARIAAADLTDLADVTYTAGPGIDNFVLTFDNATSSWGAEAAPSAPVDSVNGATGVVVLDTDDVAEGAANLYFTDARADARADTRIAAADLTDLNDVSYTAGPGIDNYVLTFDNATSTWGAEAAASAPVDSVNGATGVVVLDSDDIAEGAANLYFTDARADARADARIAAADLTDLNDVSYTAGPGIDNYVLTYDNATSSWGAEAAASAPVDSVNGATGVVVLDSDDIAEGAANLYFTDARADGRIAAADLTDLNDVSYTAGPAIDNYVLTYDNATSSWGAEPAAGGGGSRPGVYTQSASFTIGDGTGTDPGAITAAELERVYLINNGGSAVTVTLPAIGGNVGAGLKFNIKMLGTAAVTIDRNGANIDDSAANQTLSVQHSSYTLCCAGASGWYII